ncbi:ATP-binding protein [Streptomyces pilosus]|uniref:ATP-binding protein n=1 Tax=Streptomyces pilosus TaxID=28893 RepID=UPI0036FC602E
MVIPLMPQAGNTARPEPLRFTTAWDLSGVPIADARDAVSALLARAGRRADHESALGAHLVVSELVTNAVRHAPGPGALLLVLAPGADRLDIAVRDSSPHPPVVRPRDPHRIGGHGLLLVTRLCEYLHTSRLRIGKQVMARMNLA